MRCQQIFQLFLLWDIFLVKGWIGIFFSAGLSLFKKNEHRSVLREFWVEILLPLKKYIFFKFEFPHFFETFFSSNFFLKNLKFLWTKYFFPFFEWKMTKSSRHQNWNVHCRVYSLEKLPKSMEEIKPKLRYL